MTAKELARRLSTATPEQLMTFAENYIQFGLAARYLTDHLDRGQSWTDEQLEDVAKDIDEMDSK